MTVVHVGQVWCIRCECYVGRLCKRKADVGAMTECKLPVGMHLRPVWLVLKV